MRFGSLFSGIGGLDLGLERAGMQCAWQVEIDPYAREVLRKHWPDVRRYEDIREVHDACDDRACTFSRMLPVDLLCGGFPCQDLSDVSRGRGEGLQGKRSGLWWQFDRLVGELRPRWALVENVDGAAWRRWVPVVRRALFDRGYSSVPLRVRAEDAGAPFKGSRIFVVAQTNGEGESARQVHAQMAQLSKSPGPRRQDWGKPSSRALGMAHGVPYGLERRRGCGNAVVPQVAEYVGRLIMAAAT